MEQYCAAKDIFGLGIAHLQSSVESWRFDHGSGFPQLQQCAIQILSQRWNGAAKGNLTWKELDCGNVTNGKGGGLVGIVP